MIIVSILQSVINIVKKLSTIHTTYKANRPIKYIVVHYTAGVTSRKGSAINTATYYTTTDREVSSDFTVDDATVVQYNPDIKNRYTWHCGGSKYKNKGGSFYGKCTNSNSIGIEVCSTNSTGKMQNANDKSYSFTDAVVKNTEALVKQLMVEYNIPASNVIRHYDVTGKPCPGIIGWNAESGSEVEWQKFKADISGTNVTFTNGAAKYYVQVGAFSVKANAEEFLKEVKKTYPKAFIKTI